MIKKCPICGKKFIDSQEKRFCSNECLKKGFQICRETITLAPCMNYSRKGLVPNSLCDQCKLDRCRFE